MGTLYVSDEVWANLDPSAAQLNSAARIKVALWSVAAAVIAFAVLVLTASGLLMPRFTVESAAGGGSLRTCWQTMTIKNSGWFDEHVNAADLQPHGTGATMTRSLAGSDIQSGATRAVRLHFSGPICRQLLTAPPFGNGTRTPPQLLLQLRRPWGTSTAIIRLALQNDDGFHIRW
jgi:hypothetical protein